MTQPTLFPVADPLSMGKGERKRGFVPASSVEAWRAKGEKALRIANALWWVENYPNETAAELVKGFSFMDPIDPGWLAVLMDFRRGLSDAKARGLVEHAGKRPCTVAKTLAVT